MKKKIVIKLSANCDKCRKKAMRVAAVEHGVMSVAIQGDSKDQLVVVGDGVDAACLVATLRKKACYAILESLEEVKPPPPLPPLKGDDKPIGGDTEKLKDGEGKEDKPLGGDDKNSTEKKNADQSSCCAARCPSSYYHQPPYEVYNIVYDSYGPNTGCTIM